MSKPVRLIACTNETVSATVNWQLCVICQKDVASQPLVCPALSKKRLTGDGYKTLEDDLLGFDALECLPSNVNLDALNDGSGIYNTLKSNCARWHKSCRDSFNATKLSRAKKRKLSCDTSDASHNEFSDSVSDVSSLPSLSTRSSCSMPPSRNSSLFCFFCDREGSEKSDNDRLWQVRTFAVDTRVRRCAALLQDVNLLAKLSEGDMIAIEAHYHSRCLVSLYNRAERQNSSFGMANEEVTESSVSPENLSNIPGIVLGELIAYIEDIRSNQAVAPVFRLSELRKMYTAKLQQLGITCDSRQNATRLKDRILGYFPDMLAVTEGRGHDVLLMFDENLAHTLRKACQADADADGVHLVRAAQIVRRELFKSQPTFHGSFPAGCEVSSVPKSLLTLVQMILEGPCIDDACDNYSKAAASISQLMMFNSLKKTRNQSNVNLAVMRHSKCQETPLPIYISLLLHSVTRKRKLVDKLYNLGLCISYERLLTVSADVANSVCDQYRAQDVVCPAGLKPGLFTLAAFDNIDHNPSSNTAHHSFHGTSMSLMQNQLENNQVAEGFVAVDPVVLSGNSRKIRALPPSYTQVTPNAVSVMTATVPAADDNLPKLLIHDEDLKTLFDKDVQWLNVVARSVDKGDWPENISWSAYHANSAVFSKQVIPSPALTALLPLFEDSAHTVAMIKHGMECIKKAVSKLNGKQTPVIAFDQPLYALAKMIQWTHPQTFGETHFVLLLGGLHIELAAWKTVGDWLDGSGWTDTLVRADVASSGTADSFLKAHHVKRTRQAHIVTVAALYVLRNRAYAHYLSSEVSCPQGVDFDSWCSSRVSLYPQFAYWNSVLQLELTILCMVRAIREQDFDTYCESLIQLVPWFFALDHTHYARWLPVHIRDLFTLRDTHPDVAAEFEKGNFAICKSARYFSALAVDHAHEQSNKLVKDDGGAIGLTGNEHALRRWMIAGPEIARMINEFEASSDSTDCKHHEQTCSYQKRFIKEVTGLIEAFEQYDNPFLAEHQNLISLQTKVIADDSVVKTVSDVHALGKKQYTDYVLERLSSKSVSVQATLKRNNLPLFSTPPTRKSSLIKFKLEAAKNDAALFSRFYISCQSRDGNLDEFFKHENQPYPPALCCASGDMRHGCKSDLLTCLHKIKNTSVAEQPFADCFIVDGAAIVQMLRPASGMTFRDYAKNVFLRHLESHLKNAVRLDVVFDIYKPDSLKAGTRLGRGYGVRRRVTADGSIPKNWQEFLRIDDNKTELFTYLATVVTEIECPGKVIVATLGDKVVSVPSLLDSSYISPCTHEEADTRMLLHASDAARCGFRNVTLRTVDTDVVVICVGCMDKLNLNSLWIAFGTGKQFRYIAVHELARSLGPQKSRVLPLFHAITGCDTVSSFAGRGKKTAFDTWSAFPQLTTALLDLTAKPSSVNIHAIVSTVERYVVLLYDRTSDVESLDVCRKQLYARKLSMEAIPPTSDALLQHLRRAVYQAVFIWNQATIAVPQIPSASEWGWERTDTQWSPVWTTIPQASDACKELLRCGCTKSCSGRCSCSQAYLKCTALCKCRSECVNSSPGGCADTAE